MTPKVKTSIALLLGLVAGSAALQIPIVPTRAGDTVFGEENERTGWREEAPDGPDFPIPDLPVPDIHAVPIMALDNTVYFTGITLGTPPQPFRAMIDISFSDVFVPSVACKNRRFGVCNGHFSYHPSWSRTRVPTDQVVRGQDLGWLFYNAAVSRDSFSIAGLEIPDQAFHEGDPVVTDPFVPFANGLDAILGPAPDSSVSAAGTAGVLTNMFERRLLDRNIVSLLLGRIYTFEDGNEGLVAGELLFGGINEELMLPNTTMRFLSMSNKTDGPDVVRPLCNGTWQVPAGAVSVTWLNETSGENQTKRVELGGSWTARLDTSHPFIIVPPPIDDLLSGMADPFRAPYTFPFIDCRDRGRLPDLVFTLGAGAEAAEFVLTSRDYTVESRLFGSWRVCLWMIAGGYSVYRDMEVLGLGSAFTRSFYVALDAEQGKVGLGTPWWRSFLR